MAGKRLLWSSNGSSKALARQRHQMMSCGGGSNALVGQWTLKAVAAIGIILYSSSFIVVGCVFT
jgi:hypothetical protein